MNKVFRIKSIAHDTKVAKIVLYGVPDIPGVAAKLFANLAKMNVGVAMIIQNNMRGGVNDIGFLAKKEDLEAAIQVCRKLCREIEAQGVSFDSEIARITIDGERLDDHPEVTSKMFNLLAEMSINIEMIASSSSFVTCVVGSNRAEEAVNSLKKIFLQEA